jgi:hypothetical protein
MHDFCLRVGVKVRSSLVNAVAKKAFQMATVKKDLSAEIVAFVSSDIQKVNAILKFVAVESLTNVP